MTKFDPALFRRLRTKAGFDINETAAKLGISPKTAYHWDNGECKPKVAAIELLRQLSIFKNDKRTGGDRFRYIDLFAGIGGFRMAFDDIGGNCVFTSEWNEMSQKTYLANFQCDHPIAGDIREFTSSPDDLDRIPEHDVLLAGFPCQPFSIAGVSKKNALGRPHGFRCDTQGTLFFDLAQIIDHHEPAVIVLENVKNLISHDKGNTFKVIRRTLEDELGYHIQTRIIDARAWVPQHRERIFIVGFRDQTDFDLSELEIPSSEHHPRLANILHATGESDEYPYFVDGEVSPKYTLTERLWDYLVRYKEKHRAKGNGFGYTLSGPENVSRTLSARYYKDGSEILIDQGEQRPRRLTPRECARLMGFDSPEDPEKFVIPVSDTQAYRQFGNAVAVPVVRALANCMLPHLLTAVSKQAKQIDLFEY